MSASTTRRLGWSTITPPLAAIVLACLAGCSAQEPPADSDRIVLSPVAGAEAGADHTHAPGQEHASTASIGDGTTARAGGYRVADVTLPAVGRPGDVTFRILDSSGAAVTEYVEEQTKLLHLYVVREDLGSFRHLHPTLDDDGTWRARADLATAGRWRVIAEFTPGGTAAPVILGDTLDVAGKDEPAVVPRGADAMVGDDGVVRVRLLGPGRVSANGRLRLAITTLDDEPITLGSYLGAAAHLTGFALPGGDQGGSFVHVHPYGAPEVTDAGTVLTFHTTFAEPGEYRMFVQVRVDGLLHQVAVTAPVEG